MRGFFADESGAVTVDWVVLTAALVGLGLASMGVVSAGIQDLSSDIDGQLEADHVTSAFAVDYGDFDFSSYARMDPDHHAGNWTHLMGQIGGMSDELLMQTLETGLAIAQDTETTPELRGWGVDNYAAAYGQMQARGDDVSGLTHPQELIDDWQAEYGA